MGTLFNAYIYKLYSEAMYTYTKIKIELLHVFDIINQTMQNICQHVSLSSSTLLPLYAHKTLV